MIYKFCFILILRNKVTFFCYGSFIVYFVYELNNLGTSLSGYKLTVLRVGTCSIILLKEKGGGRGEKRKKRIETRVTDIRIFNKYCMHLFSPLKHPGDLSQEYYLPCQKKAMSFSGHVEQLYTQSLGKKMSHVFLPT